MESITPHHSHHSSHPQTRLENKKSPASHKRCAFPLWSEKDGYAKVGTPADKVSLSCELVNYKAKGSKDSYTAIDYFQGLSGIDCEATNARMQDLETI